MSTLWLVLYLFWVAGEIAIAIGMRRKDGSATPQDRGTQLLLWIVIIVSITAAGFWREVLPDQYHLHLPWLKPVSIGLIVVGLAIRIAAILMLGRWFTANVVTSADQRIVRSGLYGVVRHPSYLGLEIIFLAVALHSGAWPAMLLAFVPPTLALLYRIHVEEAALRRAFGDEYAEYSRTTKRLVPGIY